MPMPLCFGGGMVEEKGGIVFKILVFIVNYKIKREMEI